MTVILAIESSCDETGVGIARLDGNTDGTRLAPPFRRDALALPTRFLPKYEHLDKANFK